MDFKDFSYALSFSHVTSWTYLSFSEKLYYSQLCQPIKMFTWLTAYKNQLIINFISNLNIFIGN